MAKYKASFFAEPIRAEASWTKMHPFSFESSFLASSRKQADELAETARAEHEREYGRYYEVRLRSVKPDRRQQI